MQGFTELREWLAHLEQSKRLARTRPGIPLRHSLAAVSKRCDGKQATWFARPGNHDMDVVSGLLGQRSWVAEALGVTEQEIPKRFQEAIEAPIPWHEITEPAPIQQVVKRKPDLERDLPIPLHNEHDAGAYITAGLVIAANPQTGVQNVSINRLQVSTSDRLGILILPRDLHRFYDLAEADGKPLPIAIVIGVDPATLLASQAIVPMDVDELTIAGALHGESMPVVKCLTSELRVPAHAEIVIEGHLLPDVRAEEGPFGEFPQYYGPAGLRQVIVVDTITHRHEPLYHTIVPAAMEHLLLGAVAREASLLALLQRSFPNVLEVHLSLGGVCRYHLHVRIAKRWDGEPKNIILAALAGHADIKQVIVVDEDVDICEPQAVEWAVATRFQASEDLIVIQHAQGSRLDPSARDGLVDKVGYDATIPKTVDPFRYAVVHVPGEDDEELDRWLL